MPHAVTQSCVGDGSCVYACPVNCIQPTPDDPAFELAEMLFIDPTSCVDCGACLTACPVDAIKPHRDLDETEQQFLALNAAYHEERRARPPLAPVRPRLRVRDRGEAIRVAIVGSGPAAMYAADELLTIPGAQVDVYERLARPYGLVRSGVAPDHRRTRRVTRQLDLIRRHPRLTMHLGVEIGRDVTHDALLATHHAVIYGVGAIADRALELPGAELSGVASATEFVGWYNGHPDFAGRTFDLSHERVVVIGNGNVALDVARILTVDPESLRGTEIAPAALQVLQTSKVREVVIAARRGPEHSAFTLPELIGLSATPGVQLRLDPGALAALDLADPKLELLARLPVAAPLHPTTGPVVSRASAASTPAERQITLRYHCTPTAILGDTRARAIRFAPPGSAQPAADDRGASIATSPIDLPTGLVLSAIGYRGSQVDALPFDESSGTIPNDNGRVLDHAAGAAVPGTYVVGWIKRGPTGFIGTNKRCAQDTVAALIDDYNAGTLRPPTTAGSP